MKKTLTFTLVGVFALLLVVGFTSPVAKAKYRSFCPDDCAIYVTGSGTIFLTPISDNTPEYADLNGKRYYFKDLSTDDMHAVVKNECAKTCTIYKIDAGKAVVDYTSTI